MCNGDPFYAIERLGASCNIVNGMKYFRAVIPYAAVITNADCYSFEDNKTLLVL
jgi:hypothetical protein